MGGGHSVGDLPAASNFFKSLLRISGPRAGSACAGRLRLPLRDDADAVDGPLTKDPVDLSAQPGDPGRGIVPAPCGKLGLDVGQPRKDRDVEDPLQWILDGDLVQR